MSNEGTASVSKYVNIEGLKIGEARIRDLLKLI